MIQKNNIRSQEWLKIWNKKASSAIESKSKEEHLHKVDGWDTINLDEYSQLIDSCLCENRELVSNNLTSVEIGCGAGAFINVIKQKYPTIDIEGSDYSKDRVGTN